MENNINVLDELNKGCYMGIDALNFILDKVKEAEFRELLDKQLQEYKSFSERIKELYDSYTTDSIHETTVMEKAMTWYGIQKDTLMDPGVSNIADLLIRGTNMGVIEGKKLLNNKTMDKKVHNVCSDYIKMQEKYIERLKAYL